MMALPRRYRCTFCDKDFVRKSWYDRHSCEKKRRFIDKNEITTINAYRLFTHWQKRSKLLRRGKEKPMDDFLKSPYYKLFIKLAEFTERVYVVSHFKYLDWLIDKRVPESDWFKEHGMQDYQDYIRSSEDPEDQAHDTCVHIRSWCDDRGINAGDFFASITPGQALNMIRANELSPWVLFGYKPATDILVARMGAELLQKLNEHVNVHYWLNKVDQDKGSANRVTKYCDENLDRN